MRLGGVTFGSIPWRRNFYKEAGGIIVGRSTSGKPGEFRPEEGGEVLAGRVPVLPKKCREAVDAEFFCGRTAGFRDSVRVKNKEGVWFQVELNVRKIAGGCGERTEDGAVGHVGGNLAAAPVEKKGRRVSAVDEHSARPRRRVAVTK